MALQLLLWRVGNTNSTKQRCRKIWREGFLSAGVSPAVLRCVKFRKNRPRDAGATTRVALLYLRQRHSIVGKIVILFRRGCRAVSSGFNFRTQLQSLLETIHVKRRVLGV